MPIIPSFVTLPLSLFWIRIAEDVKMLPGIRSSNKLRISKRDINRNMNKTEITKTMKL
jgi:hypothetical protein